jgi:hypothetical protein
MLLQLPACLLLFFGITLGLAWPLAARLVADPAEKVVTSTALSLLGIFLLAWAVYVWALPPATLWTLPVLAAAGLITGARPLAATLRDVAARSLLGAQVIVSLSCVGWLALVVTYGGGVWVGDWYGHLQRTWFFLERWPRNTLFNGFDPLTSRPPLANVVNGALLALTHRNFAYYQLVSTLLGSLAFLPAALLARRFRLRQPAAGGQAGGGPAAIAVLAVLFMLSPLWVQNATYPWTKLPAAFFILSALYFFLRAHDAGAPPIAGPLFAGSLAGGILTHYSAGPYALLLAPAWLAFGWSRRREPAWWRATALAALAGALVLATWFGWALAVYGVSGTFLTNTTITDQAPSATAQLHVVALNLRDTLVPHFLRTVDLGAFMQGSPWGWWRDWCFQLYQTNLLFAFGSTAWLVLVAALVGAWRRAAGRDRTFWTAFGIGAVILGVAVHGARSNWGLAHLCLQPLVLLGLAWLAARWSSLAPLWRRVLIAGATFDFAAGIALQAGAQSGALDRWLAPDRASLDLLRSYSAFAQVNLQAKLDNHWVFLGDLFAPHVMLVAVMLAGLLMVALLWANRAVGPVDCDLPARRTHFPDMREVDSLQQKIATMSRK